MKIVLISPQGSLIAYGLRQIGACLIQEGHEVQMLFLPLPEEIEPLPGKSIRHLYPGEVMDAVADRCEGVDLVGMTCATYHFPRLAALSDHLKSRITTPIIWGGIHATVSPEECLQHADWICRGEGEFAMLDLVNELERGGDGRQIDNLGWRSPAGDIILNPLRPLLQDLDALPFPLYANEGDLILHHGMLQPLTPALACWYLSDGYSFGAGSAYHIWATRGCPHHCAFCCNSFYKGLYPNWNRIRRMSNERIIAEIQHMRASMPYIDRVAFMDDTFFAAPHAVLEDFADLYKAEVGLPFFACASPTTLDRPRMEALVDAGLRYVWIGMQSGSPRIQELYRRHNSLERLVKTGDLLASFRDRIRTPVYDFIIDPTFQEAEDQRLTLELLDRLPYPFQLALYSMTFFPGTEIANMLPEGKRADSSHDKNMVRLERTFYRFALWAYGRNLPKPWLRSLSHPFLFRLLNARWLAWLWWIAGALLESHERRQLIHWTTQHRRSVIEAHFPEEDWEAVASELFRAAPPSHPLLDRLKRTFHLRKEHKAPAE